MADYIDRIQALGYPLSYDHYDKKNGDIKFIHGVESYGEYIEGLPSVDAVEVVRCKDCKHRYKSSAYEHERCDRLIIPVLDEDFFCKWGEKE